MATKRLYQERIIKDPDILVGKPVVKGTRIPVELILAKLSVNLDLEKFSLDYPRLAEEDVKACLDYAQYLVQRQRKAKHLAREPVSITRLSPMVTGSISSW
jgi:uncharacterized protein (DUF433 family)